ncbi:MAG: twin-arginine translocation signal domain-containing protein [Anaerolineaceae bacterium]|jgi:anaerobic selenocysteine-containing dehydrogenase|nr:MAG: twin-arginine translocation signal domain-containing protein [Anaerolineaceae bacterium]
MKTKQPANCKISRRDFLKMAGVGGAATAFLGSLPKVQNVLAQSETGSAYKLADPINQVYSVCQQCNTQCGIKVKIVDGVAVKIEGNPYSPWNMVPHIAYDTPIADMGKLDAPLCPKGQAGLQSAYDPFRITQVLKRAGKRGENKWVTVPFDQAISEIVEGGKIFADISGEENREVEGLRDLRALTDAQVMKDMNTAIGKIRSEKDVEKKKELIGKFKTDFAADLDKMIDPEHPDFGPKNNQILYFWGRKKGGRSDIAHRFFGSGLGTTNRHGHTTVCQGSLYFSGKSMGDQWDGTKFTGGAKAYWQGDTASASFVIFVGASPFEANYGPTNRVPRITDRYANGEMKFAVIDPRLSKIAGKAWKWLPNKPGSEGAIALAMIQWVIANERFDGKYLALANKAASAAAKEPTWCNASWLVKIDPEKGTPGKFLHGSELKLVEKKEEEVDGKTVVTYVTTPSDGTEPVVFATDPFVVLDADSNPVLFDPNDADRAVVAGQIFVENATVGEFTVKSGLQILKESANEKTIEEYAEIAGLRAKDIEALAFEFTSHGKNACVDIHRGVSQHTNGYYNVISWYNLALLIGNYDWRGGQVYASTYDMSGAKAEGPFLFSKADPGALSPFGLSLIRHDAKYEESTIFMDLPEDKRYPAKRNWYPLASDVYEEIIPSAGDMYPYPIKAAFMYMGSPVYSLPGGHKWIEILQDVNKVPLFVANDIIIGETSMYADYIFPDVSYLERWEFGGSHPNITFKVQGVRNPVIAPLTGTVKVYGQEMAMQFEAMLLGLAEKLELPNFGPNGLGEGVDYTHPDDLYLRMVMNMAYGEKKELEDAVPEATPEEIDLYIKSHAHLPKAVFDPERWQAITGDLWPRVVTVMARAGRFQAFDKGYPGDGVRAGSFDEPYVIPTGTKYGKLINMYLEKNTGVKYAGTGKTISPVPTYVEPYMSFEGNVLDDTKDGYDLKLITYKDVRQTKSRTQGNYWLKAALPENFLVMNSEDAQQRGLSDGDKVHITSASNPDGEWDFGAIGKRRIEGKISVVEGMRPGVVAFALGFGHWANGAHDVTINGTTIIGDERRLEGFHANAAMRTDPLVTNTCLLDPVGGSAVFYDTQIKVEKA